jgi:hypothetical protein
MRALRLENVKSAGMRRVFQLRRRWKATQFRVANRMFVLALLGTACRIGTNGFEFAATSGLQEVA